MDWDDIIYIILLLFSMIFGYFYREIEDTEKRKLTGTIVGLGIVILVSGLHVLHIVLFTLINILIIKLINKKKCHLISFFFSFAYLIFFRTTIYFGIPYPPGHTNLIMMILTLKLVGLAFEINNTHLSSTNNKSDLSDEQILEQEYRKVNPNTAEIIHYGFNYIGVLTGPYYTYRSFYDSFHTNFKNNALCNENTLQKLKYVPMYSIFFLIATYLFPFSYALSDEFYNVRSFWYRAWYCIPNWFIFRMRIYIGITLSECVCTMAGLGLYPEKVEPKPGAGPTKNFGYLKELHENDKKSSQEQYNFKTIHNINPYGVDFCQTVREAMKNWNMCIQYWLAMNIYKRFPSKKWRTITTLFVSAIWHGVYIGHYFTICGAPMYLPVEDLYVKLYLKDPNNKYRKTWEWIIWFVTQLALCYLACAFHLLTVPRVMQYYNSIYHIGFIISVILYILGLYLLKKQKKDKKIEHLKNN